MPKTRTQAAQAVAQTFLPVERAAIALAADAHRAVAVMMEERSRARIGKTEGSAAIERVSQGAHLLVTAANAFLEAHADLRDLGERYQLETMFGPESASAGTVVPFEQAA